MIGIQMYEYRFKMTRVVDGDTVDGFVDLGLGVLKHERLRLRFLNTPERGQDGYREATTDLGQLCSEHADESGHLLVCTEKDKAGKFGRYLVEIYSVDGTVYLNREMRQRGWASYDGVTDLPVSRFENI